MTVAEDRSTGGMIVDVLVYLLARLALVAVLSAVIFFGAHALGIGDFPLVVGVLFAIVPRETCVIHRAIHKDGAWDKRHRPKRCLT